MFAENFKVAKACFVKYLIGIIISFFTFLSIIFIFTAATTKTVSYDVVAVKDGNNQVIANFFVGESQPEDLISTYKEQGYDVKIAPVRSELTEKNTVTAYTISQILTILMEVMIIFSVVWDAGNHDYVSKNKRFLRGFFIGCIADIPSILIYFVLLLCKFKILRPQFLSLYRFLNSQFYGFVSLIYGDSQLATDLDVGKLILLGSLLLFLPLVCEISYFIGYKNINIIDRTVYKKEKVK